MRILSFRRILFFLAFEKDSYNLGDAKGIPHFPTTEFLTSGMIQENLGGNSTTEKKKNNHWIL